MDTWPILRAVERTALNVRPEIAHAVRIVSSVYGVPGWVLVDRILSRALANLLRGKGGVSLAEVAAKIEEAGKYTDPIFGLGETGEPGEEEEDNG